MTSSFNENQRDTLDHYRDTGEVAGHTPLIIAPLPFMGRQTADGNVMDKDRETTPIERDPAHNY